MNLAARRFTILLGLATLCLSSTASSQENDNQKLTVVILAGQSNMVGHADFITIPRLFADPRPEVQDLAQLVFKPNQTVTRETVDRYIATRIARDELSRSLRDNPSDDEDANEQLQTLKESFEQQLADIKQTFAVSDRVYITSIADRNQKSGPLTIGYGANQDKIGPELGFGMSLATKIKGPILLIKTSWGGKSLNYDFRPPSAGPYQLSEKEQNEGDVQAISANAGKFYRMMIEQVHTVLDDLPAHHPDYNPQAGYELAGFVWFQGFNDQFSDAFKENYRDNMVALIKDLRSEFDAPQLPAVIGVLGTGITEEAVGKNPVSLAQRAAAQAPELKDTVAAVESYEVYDLSALEVFNKGWQNHFAEWCAVGSDRPYHYLGSGKFFVRFGDRLANALVSLQQHE